MASATFVNMCKQTHSKPKLIFLYEQTPGLMVDWSEYIINIGEIRRDINMSAGTMSITLDNSDGAFDEFLSNHQALTRKIQIKQTFVGSVIYSGNTISFADLAPNTDYINDSAFGFVNAGFVAGMPITISGSDLNDKTVTIKSVVPGTLELEATDELTTEGAGDDIILETEEIYLYTGYVDSATMDLRVKQITLNCMDRIGGVLEKKAIGITLEDGTTNSVYMNRIDTTTGIRYNSFPLSTVVWSLLVDPTQGGVYDQLDNEQSSANTDIDYDSWLAWRLAVDNGGYALYDLGTNSYGDTAGSLIMRILQLTESIMWQGGDGKLRFLCSLQSVAGQTYTKSLLIDLMWQVSMENRINAIKCKFNYDYANDLWGSDATSMVDLAQYYGPLQSPWTLQSEVIEDRTVFHNSYDSTRKDIMERFKITAAPPRTFEITTGILGYVEDIGNKIILSDIYTGWSPYDAMTIHIEEISLDVSQWQAKIKGYYLWTAGELA